MAGPESPVQGIYELRSFISEFFSRFFTSFTEVVVVVVVVCASTFNSVNRQL